MSICFLWSFCDTVYCKWCPHLNEIFSEIIHHWLCLDFWHYALVSHLNYFSCAEILRVSGMLSNQGFGDFDRLRHRSPSPMASSNLMSNVSGTGLGGWNSLQQEVTAFKLSIVASELYILNFFPYIIWVYHTYVSISIWILCSN